MSDVIVIDSALVLDQSEPSAVFQPGDLVEPQVRIPYKRPGFEGHTCRVTSIENGYVYATTLKWNRVPPWPFKARELVLLERRVEQCKAIA